MKSKILSLILTLSAALAFGYLSYTPILADTAGVSFIIRNSGNVLFDDSIPLPDEGTVMITDANGAEHSVDKRSVLAVLKEIESNSSDDFSISNLQYYSSFGSFYLKCITPSGDDELCDDWQYAVGSTTPSESIDAAILSGGETVGIYFGTSHRLVLSADTVAAGGSITATAEEYDYEDNTWNPLTGVSVGVTLPNPEDPWNPTVVGTYPVDDSGIANITVTEANTYTVGIAEDFYFPSYTLTVSAAPAETGGNGGSSGGSEPASDTLDVDSAIAYLTSVQGADGSFGGSPLYTDWVAIAFAAAGRSNGSTLSYLEANNELSSLLTDNERRAMALLALGKNPYSFSGVNYIEAITDEFDGAQFGDTDLVNDDIFALIPLHASGYDRGDEEISKSVAFIISKQKENGSWENSVDVTAAAIQALELFKSLAGVEDALDLAEEYLKNAQDSLGGWSNISSTSWALQAEAALNASWTKNGKSGLDYLAGKQETDGAVSPSTDTLANRIWMTSYAIPAGLGKPWSEIMRSVSKPETEESNSSNGSGTDGETETSAQENSNTNTTPVIAEPAIAQAAVQPETLRVNIATKNLPKSDFPNSQDGEPPLEEIVPGPAVYPVNLLAGAGSALPDDNNITKNLPMVLGTASGLLFLWAMVKLFTVA